jgi:hypothetical protein
MTYMRSWKSHRLTSHTWLGLNPQIGRPLSRIVGPIGLLFFLFLCQRYLCHHQEGENRRNTDMAEFRIPKDSIHF